MPTSDELFRMLDLNPEDEVKEETMDWSNKNGPSEKEEPTGPLSDHCLVLDEWDLAHGHALFVNRPTGLAVTEDNYADFHALAFLPYPKLEPNPFDKRCKAFIDQLLESPDWQALHKTTEMDLNASETAANNMAVEFDKLMGQKWDDYDSMESAIYRAVGTVVKESEEQIEELFSCQNALGLGQGNASRPTDAAKIKETFKRVKRSQMLKRICELAGRFRMMAQAKQRQKTKHGLDDVVGVTVSGDISKLVPVELTMLADPDFEDDAIRRLIDNQSVSRQYKGVENVGKGPIVVCVDESGSMDGDRICNAKAFALAMAWVARHQNRWCCLVGYAGGTEGTRLVLKPNKWDEVALMDWLTHFYNGGTTMDVPLVELPTTYWREINPPKGKTDIICITDGQVRVEDQMRKNFLDFKTREKVRMISIIIRGYAGDLETVSDEVYTVNGIDVTENAVERCLSL